MKVAMVKPPVIGHAVRGVGFYAQRLFSALKPFVDIEWLNFSPLPVVGFDLVHYPYFDFSWPTIAPIRVSKTVVTVHDLTPLKFPQHFPFGLRAKIVWPWQEFLLKGIDAILTDSYCSQQDIREITNINKTYVTYLAADEIFKPLKLKRENFVLYVGGANWNKNVLTLIKACEKNKIPLVLVGKEFISPAAGNIEVQPLKEIQSYIDGKAVIARGFVETADLVKLYNQCKVYVQPSVYEGFGLPVLEAMACGTPVICGKNSSLVEIAEDAVTYADVTSIEDLAEKISGVKVTGKEITQATKFSWEKTAKETYEVYQNCLAKH